MEIDQERLNAFQVRMSSWVAGQGLFFQLRYAAAVQGAQSTIFGAFMRLLTRLSILMAVLLVGFWIFLAQRVDFGWFRKDLGEKISMALGADSAVVGSVERERGYASLQRVSLEGGERSFFYDAEIRQLRTRMGLLDGVMRGWNGESVTIKELELSLKSGADSDEAAAAAYGSLFKNAENFDFEVIEVEKATITWGYSEMHRGSIQGANLKVNRRHGGGWTLVFKGGFFTQNWLRRMSIERIEVVATEESLEIVEMKLSKDGGRLDLAGKLTRGGARPEFEGTGRMTSMPIWSMVGADFREFVDGEISGDMKFGGSTNTLEGFRTVSEVSLEEGDHVILEDRFPLFRAISAVDRLRSYKKVRFSSGKFRMRTGGDRLELSNLWLRAQDLMRVEGALVVRPPTEEEVKGQLALEQRATVAATPPGGDPTDKEATQKKGDELSLRDAADARKKSKEHSMRSLIMGSQTGSREVSAISNAAEVREKEAYFLEGEVRVGVTADVFDRSPELDRRYPVDQETGMRWLALPIRGRIYSVSQDLADRFLLRSRREH
ncbi:MAG: hypothetical protein O3A92_02540 [Verrucomicrobia bacterium]|nr:hypothetical protein [Verrucomicrobiota bacterium]